jgi:DNA/RNA-binding domain of Phe-tRNA-synthetase-like protein
MYRRVGWEPTRYRPSSEALIRRIIKGKDLYRINIAVDMANLVSARCHLSMGLYDTAKICGDIIMDIGNEDETYEGISKPLIHAHNKLILRDDEGIFGNPTADSLRTSLSKNTNETLAVFFCPYEVSSDYLNETLDLLEKYYQQFSTITSKKILTYEM